FVRETEKLIEEGATESADEPPQLVTIER
ncbi:MAG: hypothetical protein QOF61_1782, partial [Acidobacteriota bacterium]|nr:hypothetical protein [Acidobacteriota bacterium]